MTEISESMVGILIDIDAILDTRMGYLKTAHPVVADELIGNPKYYLRKDDDWNDLHSSLNRNLTTLGYQGRGRDLNILKNSVITPTIRNLIEIYNDVRFQIISGNPEISDVFICLNVYPFSLTEAEITAHIEAIAFQTGLSHVSFGYINEDPNHLTIEYLKRYNFKHWFCYRFHDWIGANFSKYGEEHPTHTIEGIPDLKIYTPKLVTDQKSIEKEFSELTEEFKMDYWGLTAASFKNLFNLKYLPVSSFCVIDVDKLKRIDALDYTSMEKEMKLLFEAELTLRERFGADRTGDHEAVNSIIENLLSELLLLQNMNTEKHIHGFREKLAQVFIEMIKLYNTSPFKGYDDIKALIDSMSMEVDNTGEEYLETERFWNAIGVSTIKREVTLASGEKIFRCVADGAATRDDTGEVVNSNQILASVKKFKPVLPLVDDLILGNYFKRDMK